MSSKTRVLFSDLLVPRRPIGGMVRVGMCLTLVASVACAPLALSGCEWISGDPLKKTIPTNSDRWQDKLGSTFDDLDPEQQQLLSRYMLRMKLSGAYEAGAMPRITIGDAIRQQREYERRHPNNPTGKKSPVAKQSPYAQTYLFTLLPVKTSTEDQLNNVRLQFVLSNYGEQPVYSFQGTLLLKADSFKQGKRISIPLTQFEPPIAVDNAGKLVVESSFADMNVMRAIKNPQYVNISIEEGELKLADGQSVVFGN